MSDNNNIPQKKDSAGLALQKTGSLLSVTDKILEALLRLNFVDYTVRKEI